jgi:hypothetical protein
MFKVTLWTEPLEPGLITINIFHLNTRQIITTCLLSRNSVRHEIKTLRCMHALLSIDPLYLPVFWENLNC